jgi:hypothetical protein
MIIMMLNKKSSIAREPSIFQVRRGTKIGSAYFAHDMLHYVVPNELLRRFELAVASRAAVVFCLRMLVQLVLCTEIRGTRAIIANVMLR